ncbi:MAG: RNA polymerase sigma factor [Saprospiraceae bacterium]|nr:RNA polymerase sigma factor [Saprospiraceae bacterium]
MISVKENKLKKLLKACKKNDRKAQKALYENYFGLMMNISMRYTKNWEEAKEVLNIAFLKIFTKIDDFMGQGSFEGWMKRIVINTALDKIRSNKQIFQPIETLNNYDQHNYVENEAISNIETQKIIDLIQELPPMSRAVFNMYAIEGYKHKEIAAILEIKEGTSFWHLQNARKILIEKLANAEVRKAVNH